LNLEIDLAIKFATQAIWHSGRNSTSAIFNVNIERKSLTNLNPNCSTLPLNMAEVLFLPECQIAPGLLTFHTSPSVLRQSRSTTVDTSEK